MNPEALLGALNRGGVRFVIVGGAAMIIHGSSYITEDLDIVYARDADNVRKLVAALAPLRPRLRALGQAVAFKFDERTIKNGMNFTLTTSAGNIDLLGEISGIGGYDAAAKQAQKHKIGGSVFEVLSIRGLVRAKRAAGRRKDLVAIPELEALQELRDRTELPKEP